MSRPSTLGQQHLVLVGLTGSGKTTIGRLAAERLGRPFLDTDAGIEERTGRSVRTIFAEDGEDAFRDIESTVLRDALLREEPTVIAAAGGAVLRPENRKALRESSARVVWLCAGPAAVSDRVKGGGHRPLLDNDPDAALRQMWAAREPLYREVADAIVGVEGRSVHEVLEAVLR
jgi:shikimate kinase